MRFEEINGNVFYNGDCIAGGTRAHIPPDDSVDLIVTDPPLTASTATGCTSTTTVTRRSSSTATSRFPHPITGGSSAITGYGKPNGY
ncbi:hypothetical protein [Methanoculleus chikugoensis]|uniref:hypothetical protein n=1 Tax=Methanoculleus chikugoensis TaxID=118126 RepID=UPI001FB21B15|nr:hypothetical protein [Methanoculleus chikugoensis]